MTTIPNDPPETDAPDEPGVDPSGEPETPEPTEAAGDSSLPVEDQA